MYETMNFLGFTCVLGYKLTSNADTVDPSARLHITIRYGEY
jgi:hypothetical protein